MGLCWGIILAIAYLATNAEELFAGNSPIENCIMSVVLIVLYGLVGMVYDYGVKLYKFIMKKIHEHKKEK